MRTIISVLLFAYLLMPSVAYMSAKKANARAPEITSVSSETVSLEGGTRLIVKGNNFAPDSVVVMGDSVINAVVGPRAISFTVPQQKRVGRSTLTIITNNGLAQRELRVVSKPLAELADGEITTIMGGIPFLGD